MNNPQSYLEHEKALNSGNVNRAAALFPFWIGNGKETFIVFQNYWKWKRSIEVEMRLSIYDNLGNKINFFKDKVKKNNYELIISSFFQKNQKVVDSGMLELEILTSKQDNIVFPFPAVMVYYTNGKGDYSCVHTAGRTLSNNDNLIQNFDESNFYCKLNKDMSPFIHVFTGKDSFIKNFCIEILSTENKLISKISLPDITSDYISKVIYLRNLLSCDLTNLLEKMPRFFLKITGHSKGIYPRFIVGNYSFKKDMHYATHSFRTVKEDDFIPLDNIKEEQYLSSIALVVPPKLTLISSIYPTCGDNAPVGVIKLKEQQNGLSLYNEIKSQSKLNLGLNNGEMVLNTLENGQSSGYMTVKSSSVPSRINCGLEFFSKNSYHSTDIALQFRAFYSKKKFNFWGHIDNFKNFKSYLLVSNFFPDMNNNTCHLDIKIELEDHPSIKKNFIIKPGTCQCIDFKKDFSEFFNNNTNSCNFISWRAEILQGEIQDIYVLSFNEKTGSVFGDHSF